MKSLKPKRAKPCVSVEEVEKVNIFHMLSEFIFVLVPIEKNQTV